MGVLQSEYIEPQDIANAILFLASDKASWITEQVIIGIQY